MYFFNHRIAGTRPIIDAASLFLINHCLVCKVVRSFVINIDKYVDAALNIYRARTRKVFVCIVQYETL